MPVHVILARHGEAAPADKNSRRPLSGRGVEEVEAMARLLEPLHLSVDEIRHSGKKRAEETAAILGRVIESANGIRSVPGMRPNDDIEPVARLLNTEGVSVMLVGHMPFLSSLASFLIFGRPDLDMANFTTASMAGLIRTPLGWRLDWFFHPRMFT